MESILRGLQRACILKRAARRNHGKGIYEYDFMYSTMVSQTSCDVCGNGLKDREIVRQNGLSLCRPCAEDAASVDSCCGPLPLRR